MSCQGVVHDFTGKGGGLQKQCNCGKSWWDAKDQIIATLTAERDAALAKVREMAAQYDVLAKQLAETEADLQAVVEDLQMAQGQWGDEYLWEKWGLNEALARPGVKRVMEATCSPQTK
jgi:hypothetical protein